MALHLYSKELIMQSSGMTPNISAPSKPALIEYQLPLQGKNGVGITNPSSKKSHRSIPLSYSCPEFSQNAEMAQQYPRFRIRPTHDSSAKGYKLGQLWVGDNENTAKKPQFGGAIDLQLYECWVILADFKFPEIFNFVVPPQVFF